MKTTWGLEQASNEPRTITTLGSYDGIHLGHQAILKRLREKKTESGLARSLVVTFDPHPQIVLRKNDTSIELLTTIDERLSLIENSGIDEVLVIRFTPEFAKIPYNEFFNRILVESLGTRAMVVGFNHAFGKNREGDMDHLKMLASNEGILVEGVPPYVIKGESVSSTKIRNALKSGNVGLANECLGRSYSLTGTVESGDKIGRVLGFPTINLRIPENKLVPGDGVYNGFANVGGRLYPAGISIGTRPTIESDGRRIVEAYLIDFNEEIYGKTVTITLSSWIRHQLRFDSLDELESQIHADILEIRNSMRI